MALLIPPECWQDGIEFDELLSTPNSSSHVARIMYARTEEVGEGWILHPIAVLIDTTMCADPLGTGEGGLRSVSPSVCCSHLNPNPTLYGDILLISN